MFDYDWFHGSAFAGQQDEARLRCTLGHFPHLTRQDYTNEDAAKNFFEEIQVRRLVYLRDGFSYEIRQLADMPSKAQLTFECEPVDEQYKVGSFIVSIPYDEIVRVEVFAVHPSEKPDDGPQITGFRSRPDRPMPQTEEPS
jgi:hypothetical protein